MKTKFLLGASLGVCMLAWGAKDQVIMTVNGVDVPKSEFEYLYHKNSQQQLTPQPLGEYVEMFKNYRLKVADALAEGIDTTAAFRQEMAQYREELAAPYLADSTYLDKLVKEAYDRSLTEVENKHIMLFKSRNSADNVHAKHVADSLQKVLSSDPSQFEDLAGRYSHDRGSNTRGGNMGYIPAGRLPYAFEVAAYSLQPGEISQVVESPVGYHILKGGDRRPARGQVRVSHIMKAVRPDATAEDQAIVKNTVDSIYSLLKADKSRFEELAMANSDDPGSAREGGLLPWFGAGQMVQEFDSVAFALPVESISEPFRTRFGWHIVYKLAEKPVPALGEMREAELKRLANPQDPRFDMIRDNMDARLALRHKGALDMAAIDRMKLGLVMNGLDSLFYDSYNNAALRAGKIGKVGKRNLTAGELVDSFRGHTVDNPDAAQNYFDEAVRKFYHTALLDAELDRLEAEVPDYRNLLHEYENGSLLYEVSNRKVWNRAAKDEEGLKNFFEQHRADYKWSEPRAKGILVQAKNDSVAQAIAARYAELPAATALTTLRKEFKGQMQADRVLLPKGQNAMVDNLLFGAPETSPSAAAYNVYFMIDGKVLYAPEVVTDVRGQVTSDYQEYLEQEWLKALHEKYPVSVNEKVLKKVK